MAKANPVLVVEDDVDIREALQEILQVEGFSVETAENGRVALEKLERIQHPCLILLDLFMPIMDGPGFLAQLRRADQVTIAAIPVLIISAAPQEGNAVRSALPQAQGFLKKPVDMDLLLQLVERYCCRVGQTANHQSSKANKSV